MLPVSALAVLLAVSTVAEPAARFMESRRFHQLPPTSGRGEDWVLVLEAIP